MGKKTTRAARFLFYTEVQPVLLLFSRLRELKSEASAAVFLAAVALSPAFAHDFFLRKYTHEGFTPEQLIVCCRQTIVCSHQTIVCSHQTIVCCRQTKRKRQ
mgnify:FL=1